MNMMKRREEKVMRKLNMLNMLNKLNMLNNTVNNIVTAAQGLWEQLLGGSWASVLVVSWLAEVNRT